jgi:hypothetical protein
MKQSRFGLPVKVVVIAVIAITFMTMVFGIYRFRNESSELYRDLNEKMQDRIVLLSPSLKKPLFDYDEQAVKDILLPQMENKAIIGLFISYKYKVLYGFIRNKTGNIVSSDKLLSEKGNILKKQIIRSSDNTELGTLSVYGTDIYVRDVLKKRAVNALAELIIMNVLIAAILYFFMRKILITLLKQMSTESGVSQQNVIIAEGLIEQYRMILEKEFGIIRK